jgi:hypothetical protein
VNALRSATSPEKFLGKGCREELKEMVARSPISYTGKVFERGDVTIEPFGETLAKHGLQPQLFRSM